MESTDLGDSFHHQIVIGTLVGIRINPLSCESFQMHQPNPQYQYKKKKIHNFTGYIGSDLGRVSIQELV